MKRTGPFLLLSIALIVGLVIGVALEATGILSFAKSPIVQKAEKDVNQYVPLAAGTLWLPTAINSEESLDEVLVGFGGDEMEVIRYSLDIAGNKYICCVCDPYSGSTRTHVLLFAGGPRLQLISHIVINLVAYNNVLPGKDGENTFILTDKLNGKVRYATIAIK